VGPLHDPAGTGLDGGGDALAGDLAVEAQLIQQLAGGLAVIAAVLVAAAVLGQDVIRLAACRVGAGSGESCRFAPAEAMPSGMPYPSLATERFSPLLATSLFADPAAAFCGDASARLREHPGLLRQLNLAPGLALAAIWIWQRP